MPLGRSVDEMNRNKARREHGDAEVIALFSVRNEEFGGRLQTPFRVLRRLGVSHASTHRAELEDYR